jgi:protein-L-isoaspartate(D-aspartate) O-methyltransferase
VVTAAAHEVPSPLVEQLRAPDDTHRGGRLVIPVGDKGGQRMMRLQKMGPSSDDVETEAFDTFRFVPLVREKP